MYKPDKSEGYSGNRCGNSDSKISAMLDEKSIELIRVLAITYNIDDGKVTKWLGMSPDELDAEIKRYNTEVEVLENEQRKLILNDL